MSNKKNMFKLLITRDIKKTNDISTNDISTNNICNYANIKRELLNNNFKIIENGFQCVFIK